MLKKLFRCKRAAVIGMVHVQALPGTPRSTLPPQQLMELARHEAEIYRASDVDGVIVENMHDAPYVQAPLLGPEVTATMTAVCGAVKGVMGDIPVGCQILACGNKEALAVASASGLQFIRAEGFVFGHLADEGWTDACAGDLLRYRRSINANHISVWADIKKKHSSHSITSDVTLAETAHAAQFFLADAVVVTGAATGAEADSEQLQELVSAVPGLPIAVGSGVTATNIDRYLSAHALIVGSHFKEEGVWSNDLSKDRVKAFMDLVKSLR